MLLRSPRLGTSSHSGISISRETHIFRSRSLRNSEMSPPLLSLALPSETGRVLSIQSHTVQGYVGNKSAVFPLQLLGYDVDPINSVQFSNHTGYPSFKGQVLNGQQLWELIEGLEANNLLYYTHLLTGYIGSVSFLNTILEVVNKLRSVNPKLIYVCDPVLGDEGKLYVPSELVSVYREKVVPVASMLTPNQFEAEQLTGFRIGSERDGREACNILHAAGPSKIFHTAIQLTAANFGNQKPQPPKHHHHTTTTTTTKIKITERERSVGRRSVCRRRDRTEARSKVRSARCDRLGVIVRLELARSSGAVQSSDWSSRDGLVRAIGADWSLGFAGDRQIGLELGVVITSIVIDGSLHLIGSHQKEKDQSPEQFKIVIPKIPAYFTGTGDLMTSLLLGWSNKYPDNLDKAAELAVSSLQALLQRTLNDYRSVGYDPQSSSLEIRLIQSQDDIRNPQVAFKAEKFN